MFIALALAAAPLSGPCADAAPVARIEAEPGDRGLDVEGLVLQPDGETPAAGVVVYAYQTGADGDYDAGENGAPARRAWMKTDADGRFELRTIMPGGYPGSREPAHVHIFFWGEDTPAQWTPALNFSEDERVTDEVRARSDALGDFGFVMRGANMDGLRVVYPKFKLKPQGDRFETSIRHGLDACEAS